jgi:hypothetical protein
MDPIGDTLIFLDRIEVLVGLFHRLPPGGGSARTGERIWASDYPTGYVDDFGFDPGPRATPTIAEGRVYTFGAEGMLNCWELASGKNLWRVDTKKEFAPRKGSSACPARRWRRATR